MTDRPDAPDIVEIMAAASVGEDVWGLEDAAARAGIREDMRDVIRALDAAGYAVVPVVPTPEMTEAATGKLADPVDRDETRGYARYIWAAMITAGNLAGRP